MTGFSFLQGAHHSAQNSTTTFSLKTSSKFLESTSMTVIKNPVG